MKNIRVLVQITRFPKYYSLFLTHWHLFLQDVHGFSESNITLLMDDGQHTEPTYANIMAAYATLVASSQAGDAVFCHYSGHGGKVTDDDGDESK